MEVLSGTVTPLNARSPLGVQRCIKLSGGARLILKGATGFKALEDFPRDLGWLLLREKDSGGGLRIGLERITLCEAKLDGYDRLMPIILDWPTRWDGDDLWLEQIGAKDTLLSVGPLIDPRAKLRPFLKGRGVEVGPGLRPLILPGDGIDIDYVEERHPSEWRETYAKGREVAETLSPEILARYRVGSAVELREWPPDSLDFIFSNHVFEHFINPIQVLSNWIARLRPGGVIAGVIPESRYTFDLRQPFSRIEEFREEFERGDFSIPDAKYERWVRFTSPSSTVQSLKDRKYSVHMHYYTPAVFRALVDEARRAAPIGDLFMDTANNNKDFGFLLRRAAAA